MTTDFDTARDLQRQLDDFAGDDLDYFSGDGTVSRGDYDPPAPKDADEVNRVLRRIRACEREAAEISAVAAAELQRITAWAEDRKAGVERQRAWLERAVEGWMRQHNAATGAKTVELPNGKVKLRAGRVKIVGEEANLSVLWKSPDFCDLIRQRLELDRQAVAKKTEPGPVVSLATDNAVNVEVRQAVNADGEPVPGVYYERYLQPTFSVDVSETDQPAEPGVE